ncbi:MAG: AAA family ATPase [Lentisphaeria bacterium]|jgi:MoxR-like ATPase|nr:AAA family ATPase [Lentisphaeria bacterium]
MAEITTAAPDDVAAIEQLHRTIEEIRTELATVVVGQDEVIQKLLICMLARGHALLMGVPGLAKTLMVHTLADALTLEFNRIQFTPDLMPADITGTDILQETEPGRRAFEFARGPIFANIVLADEINRTPPKTQAALLETMQENQVTAAGRTMALDQPFFVLATQNPIEQEGTYPLPEAQLDRFMFLIKVDYPSSAEEVQIAKRTTGADRQRVHKIIDGRTILNYQQLVRRVPVPDHIYDYAVALVRSTRPGLEDTPDWIKRWVTWGAGPRAVQYLILGAKVHAVFDGSYLVREEDIRNVANDVLRHRIVLNFHAESEGITSDHLVERLVEECVV